MPFTSPRALTKSMAPLAQWSCVSMKSLELSTILTVAPPFTVSRMPSSVGMEFLTISSVPSGWTSTATVPGVALETGISTFVSPVPLGSSTLTVGAVLLLREASTSTGAFTASPFFLASSTALLLTFASAAVLLSPFSMVVTVIPVEPLAMVVLVVSLPEVTPFLSVLVSDFVSDFVPSLEVMVSVLLSVTVPSFLVSVRVSLSTFEPSLLVSVSFLVSTFVPSGFVSVFVSVLVTEPSLPVVVSTLVPSGFVTVSTFVPSGLVAVSGLVGVVLLEPPPPPEEEPPELPPVEPPG